MMTDMDFSAQAKTGLAKTFWAGCRREAYASLYNPFVISLAAGTLPKHAFQRYMAQDAYFLEAFKNAYVPPNQFISKKPEQATDESTLAPVA
jgi:thiaminase